MSSEDSMNNSSSQIFCLTWVKRKAAKPVPDQIRLSESEIAELLVAQDMEVPGLSTSDHSHVGGEDDDENNTASSNTNNDDSNDDDDDDDDDDDLKEFNFKDYDNESDAIYGEKMSDLVVYSSNKDDPYMKKKVDTNEESDEEINEKEAVTVRDDDNLLVAGRCDKDCTTLEVFVYNHSNKEFYCHHDLNLDSPPLCMQWLNFDAGSAHISQSNDMGNFVALGYMEPLIEIWDLDVMNAVEPAFTLGVPKKEGKKISKTLKNCGHKDAILDMSWSDLTRKKFASASADRCVALWDLQTCVMERRFKVHRDKVQTLEWKPGSNDCLLSGAFDGRVIALDTKATPSGRLKWNLSGEIERVAWNADDSNYFVASSDAGDVYYCDVRVPVKPMFHYKAHDDAITALLLTSEKLHTASSDGSMKIWNIKEQKANLISERNMKMGMVHCFHENPDIKNIFAVGGEKGGVRILDTRSSELMFETEPPKDPDNLSDALEEMIQKELEEETKNKSPLKSKSKKKKKPAGNDAVSGDHDVDKNNKQPAGGAKRSDGKTKSPKKKRDVIKEQTKQQKNATDVSVSDGKTKSPKKERNVIKEKTKQQKNATDVGASGGETKSPKKKIDTIKEQKQKNSNPKTDDDVSASDGKTKSPKKKCDTVKEQKQPKNSKVEKDNDVTVSDQPAPSGMPMLQSSSENRKRKRKRGRKTASSSVSAPKRRRLYPKQRKKLMKKLVKKA